MRIGGIGLWALQQARITLEPGIHRTLCRSVELGPTWKLLSTNQALPWSLELIERYANGGTGDVWWLVTDPLTLELWISLNAM